MNIYKHYLLGYYGSQIGLPLVNHAGHVIEPSAKKHPWESHDGCELAVTVKGKIIYEVQDQGDVTVPGGYISLMKAGQAHRGKEGIFYPCNLYWFNLNPLSPGSTTRTPFTCDELSRIFAVFNDTDLTVTHASPFLLTLLEQYGEALNEWSKVTPRPALEPDLPAQCSPELVAWLRTLLCTIISEISHCFSYAETSTICPYVRKACTFMNKHFHEEININDVVDYLGVSEVYLYKRFEKEIGQTPNGYLHTLRLEKACELLVSTDKSITEIAMETGFSSSQYFATVFRKYSGETPSVFRRRIISTDETE
jgi:AraC-like DNA-binding protein